MADIKKITAGWSGIRAKINELVTRVNALSGTTVVRYDADEPRADQLAELIEVGTNQAFIKLRPQGGKLPGYHFYFADGVEIFIASADALENYDPDTHANWAIKIPVSGDSFDSAGTITYDDGAARYDGDAAADPPEPQTYYRVHIVRGSRLQSLGGSFEEDGFCAGNKGPIVRMLKLT